MSQSLSLIDGPVSFAGAISLEQGVDGVRPWRLMHDHLDLFEPIFRERAVMPAGVRVTTVSDTDSIAMEVAPADAARKFDLLVNGVFLSRVELDAGQTTVQFDNLPAGEHRLEIWLPQGAEVTVRNVSIADGATAAAYVDDRPKWTVYGSSITHCGSAAGPSETWPALVATRFNLNLNCMGYGGNCQMEPIVTRMIRDLPADYISTCVGINVMGAASLNYRTFRAAVIGMIVTARDLHPDTPMVVVSPISNPPREETPNAAEMTLVKMREAILDAVESLQKYGDTQLIYQDGLELFGHDLVHHMPDKLHPDAAGTHVLAERYGDIVMPKLGVTEPVKSA